MRAESGPYTRITDDVFRPESDPESSAREMARHTMTVSFPVKSWSVHRSVVVHGKLEEGDRILIGTPGSHLRAELVLDTDRRALYTLREEGATEIPGEFVLKLYSDASGHEVGGELRHRPAYESKWSGDSEPEFVSGQVIMPAADLREIVDQMERGTRCAVSLRMRLFKEQIAHSFDEHWMRQELYLPWDERIPIQEFQASFANELEGKSKDERDQEETAAEIKAEESWLPVPALDRGLAQRLNWVVALLALIAAALIFGR